MRVSAWVASLLALAGQCTSTELSSAGDFNLLSPLPLDAEMNYEFGGSTVMSRRYVRLTPDAKDKRGWVVSRTDSLLPENFEFTMDFKLEGEGRTLYGDGMALWFTEERPREGSMMGLDEFYKGVAIIIDSYRNGKAGRIFPRLVLAQNNGTRPYDKDHDGHANEIDSCGLRGTHNNKRQDYSTIRVSYSRAMRKLYVEANFRNKWELCASGDIDMGPVSKIAVSAATGDLSENHIIKDLLLKDFGPSLPPSLQELNRKHAKKAPEERETRGFFALVGFLFRLVLKLAAAAGLGLIAFKGYKEFRKYQQRREDDLYKLN